MPYRIGEVAEHANVPEDFVRQLIDLGALLGEEGGLGIPEVRRSRLLHSWAAAGLSVETILALVDRGALSLAFLDTPWMQTPERLDRSYRQLAADRGVPVAFLQAVHQALGFAPASQATGPARTTPPCWTPGAIPRCQRRRRSDAAAPGRVRRQPAADRQGRGRLLRDQHRAALAPPS